MNLHIPTEFNCYIRHIHALSGELMALEVVIQQTNRQRALRFHVLSDDEIHGALFHHAHVAICDIVHDHMNLFAALVRTGVDRTVNPFAAR